MSKATATARTSTRRAVWLGKDRAFGAVHRVAYPYRAGGRTLCGLTIPGAGVLWEREGVRLERRPCLRCDRAAGLELGGAA